MTTPERFRRRQRIEALAVVIVGLFSVWSGWHFDQQQKDQQDCIERKFSEFTTTLKLRGNLTTQQLNQFKNLIDGALESTTPQDFEPVKKQYNRTSARIARIKANHPIQAYPNGACDPNDKKPREKKKGEASLPWKPFSLS